MKAYRLWIILLGVIIALPFAGRLAWLLQKSKPMEILIINKSVQKSSMNEVKTLNWTLNNEKIVNLDKRIYDYTYQYYGYFPEAPTQDRKIKSFSLENISDLTEKNNVLFFADNYGIEPQMHDAKTVKKKAYGGFNNSDYILLKDMVNKQKLVIAEYNFISLPTEDLVRYNTEQFLDIYSLGWSGKYFKDLSKEQVSELIETKWFDLYKQLNSEDWTFSGPGLILLNSSQNRIIVMPADKYMISEFPEVITNSDLASKFNIPEKAAYSGWFDMSYQGQNKVISHFNLNLNENGISLLKKNGIEAEFPAVIESANSKFYYLAGDFSKVHVFMPFSRLGFLSSLFENLNKGKVNQPDKFFLTYYNNLLSTILNNYYLEISH